MRAWSGILIACAIANPAFAQEPVGCSKFKWPLDKKRATLNGTDLPKVFSGERVTWPIPWAATVALVPFADARLPAPPERAPKSPGSFAGFVQLPAPARAMTYEITLSSEGWIDVVQDGHAMEVVDFTGATGCAGVRKSVKFDLAARPLTVTLSGVAAAAIGIAITAK